MLIIVPPQHAGTVTSQVPFAWCAAPVQPTTRSVEAMEMTKKGLTERRELPAVSAAASALRRPEAPVTRVGDDAVRLDTHAHASALVCSTMRHFALPHWYHGPAPLKHGSVLYAPLPLLQGRSSG